MAWWQIAGGPDAGLPGSGILAGRSETVASYGAACLKVRDLLASDNAVEAVAVAIPAAEQFPHGIDIHRLMGIAYLNQSDHFNARRAFDIALEGDPGDLVAQVGVAEVEEATDGPAVAIRAWRRAWEIEPGTETIAARLREVQRRVASEGQTAPYGTEGQIDGPIPHTHASIVRTHLRSGLFEHAMLEAVTALTQDKSRTDVQLLLAEAWWRSGETEIAHSIAASILEKFPFCVVANLLVALHRRVVSRDPRQQIERTREADPFDRIASSLFMGRDIPPLFDDQPVNGSWSTVRSSTGSWPVVMGNSQARQVANQESTATHQSPREAHATDGTATMALPPPQIEKLPKTGGDAPVSSAVEAGNGEGPTVTDLSSATEELPLASESVPDAGSSANPVLELPALPGPEPDQTEPVSLSDPGVANAIPVNVPASEPSETESRGHETLAPAIGLPTPVESTEASDPVEQVAIAPVNEGSGIDAPLASLPTEEASPTLSVTVKSAELDNAPDMGTTTQATGDQIEHASSGATLAAPHASTTSGQLDNPSTEVVPKHGIPETTAEADLGQTKPSPGGDPVADRSSDIDHVKSTTAVNQLSVATSRMNEPSDFDSLSVAELREAGERAAQQRRFTEAIRLYSIAISRIRATGNQARR